MTCGPDSKTPNSDRAKVRARTGGVAVGGSIYGNVGVKNYFVQGKPLTHYEVMYRHAICRSATFRVWQPGSYIPLDLSEKRVETTFIPDLRIPLVISRVVANRIHSEASSVADLAGVNKETTTVQTILRKHRRAFLLGDPGSGKTTTLRWLMYELAAGEYDSLVALPAYLDLSVYTEEGGFLQWIRTQMSRWPGGEVLKYARTSR